MSRRIAIRSLVALWGVLLGVPASADEFPVAVSSIPIRQFDARTPVGAAYGKLTFLGGVQLRSSDPDFGGLSGLRLSEDGRRFTAVSDRGSWFRGEIRYDARSPIAVTGVSRQPLEGPRGLLPGRRGSDTEALEISGSSAWVASERVNEVLRFALDGDGRPGTGRRVTLPKDAQKAPFNQGFEALALTKGGALMMVAEKYLDAQGDNRGFVAGAKTPFAFSVRRTEDFSPTDLARLPNGGYVLLERRYVPPISLSVRLRRLDEDDVKPGAVVDGPVLMEASFAQTIDNFEGISAHPAADGGVVITLVSDDNFSALQRTLLMQFELRN